MQRTEYLRADLYRYNSAKSFHEIGLNLKAVNDEKDLQTFVIDAIIYHPILLDVVNLRYNSF